MCKNWISIWLIANIFVPKLEAQKKKLINTNSSKRDLKKIFEFIESNFFHFCFLNIFSLNCFGKSPRALKLINSAKENPIISSQYHHHYGHCITIDISNLSKNDGRYHTKIGSHKLVLHMLLKPIIGHARPLTGNFIFIHNGSNINQFGEKIQDRFIPSGLHYHVRFRAKSFFTVIVNYFFLFH